jgi:single-strand DNA-binding protein
MLNRVVLIGRLVADPELRYTGSGVPVANFRIAVDRPFTNAAGERETDFINIVAWRQRAEFAANYLGKGRLVAIDGMLQIRQWTTQDGQRRSTAEVVADNVRGLDRPREPSAEVPDEGGGDVPSDASEVGEDDVPGVWDDQ